MASRVKQCLPYPPVAPAQGWFIRLPMTRTALYTGSFDPVTNGHLDVVRHACRLVDRLVIAIGVHSSKAPIFTAEERAEMLRGVCGPAAAEQGTTLEVVTFD